MCCAHMYRVRARARAANQALGGRFTLFVHWTSQPSERPSLNKLPRLHTYALSNITHAGHVYTFDFHEARVEQATKEFRLHGMSHIVTCQQADACENGFQVCWLLCVLFRADMCSIGMACPL